MRRKDSEVTDFKQTLGILENCDCCRLGLLDDVGVYMVPLNFGFEDAGGQLIIYCHGAAEGKKIDLIRKEGKASFEADCKHELMTANTACAHAYRYQSVMARGKAQVLDDYAEKVHGLQKVMCHYTGKDDWEYKEEQVNTVAVIKLTIDSWSAKENIK